MVPNGWELIKDKDYWLMLLFDVIVEHTSPKNVVE